MSLPGPDEALTRTGRDLDCFGEIAIARHPPMVVPVGADQIGEHLGVPSIFYELAHRLGCRSVSADQGQFWTVTRPVVAR
jgi:hypothetical protein